MTRVYVAGPMTGLPEFNYPAFRAAAEQLAAAGFEVEDPSTNVNPTPDDYHGWLRAGLAQLIRCDGVALLNGWETSGGARLEVNTAATLGLRVAPLAEWLPGVRNTERPQGFPAILRLLDEAEKYPTPDGTVGFGMNRDGLIALLAECTPMLSSISVIPTRLDRGAFSFAITTYVTFDRAELYEEVVAP